MESYREIIVNIIEQSTKSTMRDDTDLLNILSLDFIESGYFRDICHFNDYVFMKSIENNKYLIAEWISTNFKSPERVYNVVVDEMDMIKRAAISSSNGMFWKYNWDIEIIPEKVHDLSKTTISENDELNLIEQYKNSLADIIDKSVPESFEETTAHFDLLMSEENNLISGNKPYLYDYLFKYCILKNKGKLAYWISTKNNNMSVIYDDVTDNVISAMVTSDFWNRDWKYNW